MDDLDEAEKQVGKDGVIILAPWSYKINSILRKYFENQLSVSPPPLTPGITILVLTSNEAFVDYYVSFPTRQLRLIFENVFTNIQIFGVRNIVMSVIRNGLTFRLSTAQIQGSSIDMVFDLDNLMMD